MTPLEETNAFLADVRARRDFADQRAKRYRRLDLALLIASIVCGLVATSLAADAAKGGSVAAEAVAASTTGKTPAPMGAGWRNLCGIVAACTFLGTLASALNSGLKLAEHRAQAMTCAGRLDALHAELIAAGENTATMKTVKDEFLRVLRDYPQYLR
jgi:hypothetical protein